MKHVGTPLLGFVFVLAIGCSSEVDGSAQHSQVAPGDADLCVNYVVFQVEATFRDNSNQPPQLGQILDDYGRNSPEYEAWLIAVQDPTATRLRVDEGVQAALNYVRPQIEETCNTK